MSDDILKFPDDKPFVHEISITINLERQFIGLDFQDPNVPIVGLNELNARKLAHSILEAADKLATMTRGPD